MFVIKGKTLLEVIQWLNIGGRLCDYVMVYNAAEKTTKLYIPKWKEVPNVSK